MSDDRGIQFKISAPGRIVLSGEHSAMYGKSFVMAGLNLRTTLEFIEFRNTEYIKVEFCDVQLLEYIPLEEVKRLLSDSDFEVLVSNPADLLEYVKHFITVNSLWSTRKQKFSLQVFLFLLYIIIYREGLLLEPFGVRVTSDIPIGACFGSSTSFAVCLAACFLHWKRLQSGPHTEFNDADLASIIRYTELCEKLMQDYVFASADAQVCVHGKIQKFQIIDYKVYSSVTIDLTKEIMIVLFNAGFTHSKNALVLEMMRLKRRKRHLFDELLNQLDEIATRIYDNLNQIRNTTDNLNDHAAAYSSLEENIARNHGILRINKLSSNKINMSCSCAATLCLTGKLTGFAGYAYFVVPLHLIGQAAFICLRLQTKLKDHNSCSITAINCRGVTINN